MEIAACLLVATVLLGVGLLWARRRARRSDPAISSGPRESPESEERLARREVVLRGEITEENANVVMAKLLYLDNLDSATPITLVVDSVGGSVIAGLAIVDTLAFVAAPVHTRCEVRAHSIAAIVVACGEAGQRAAASGAELSLSLPWGSPEGDAADLEALQREIDRLAEGLVSLVAAATGRERQEVRGDFERETRFDAAGARDYGLVDLVADS